MATAEMLYLSTVRWLAALVVAASSLATPVAVLAGGTSGEPEVDASGSGDDVPQSEAKDPVERYFIRSTGDSGMLAQRYPHLAVWLEPEGAPRALALVEREAGSPPRGGVVILADEGRTANDALIETLRRHLTEAGWAAMSLGNDELSPVLQLAKQQVAAGAQGSDDEEASQPGQPVMIDVNDQAAEDLLQAYRDEMNARLAAAVAWLQEQDYEAVMLVGIGRGAVLVNNYLPLAPDVVTQAAWVAPVFSDRSPDELAAGLESLKVRLLDLYPSAATDVVRRRAAFRRAGMTGYESLPIPLQGGEAARHGAAIASRLTGWADGD